MSNSRTLLLILCFSCVLSRSAFSATIIAWNFNSPLDDLDPSTGSLSPSRGEGAFTVIGGATSEFGTVGGANTSDPATLDDSQLRLRSLPKVDAGNKTAGVEFTIVTQGFEHIALSWDQYNSRTASRYWRVQYTRDGFSWTDYQTVENTNASTWVRYQVSFADIPALNNRPYLSIRLVQEFESSATGAGPDAYAAVDPSAAYSTAGSWWLDMVTVSARVIGATNAGPTISVISDIIATEGEKIDSATFTVADAETEAVALVVTATVTNPDLISNLSIAGTGNERTLSLDAAKSGETEITLRVTDAEGDFTEARFKVTILSESVQETPNFFVAWNFNGPVPDADSATGSFEPSLGSGALTVIGTENHTFGTVGQGRTSDTIASDNSMLRIAGFPRQGEGNQTCGFEITASTAGMRDIILFWDQYNSATASRNWRIQYSTNGSELIDFISFTNTTSSTWLRRRTVSFREVPGAANNPFFRLRFVSEFASEAGYAAVSSTSTYGSAGTLWLDMIGLSGERLPDQPEAPPALTISRGSDLRLSWLIDARNYVIEFKNDWTTEWTELGTAPEERDGSFQILIEPTQTSRFFRLRQNPAP